jgi:hypothetical protein
MRGKADGLSGCMKRRVEEQRKGKARSISFGRQDAHERRAAAGCLAINTHGGKTLMKKKRRNLGLYETTGGGATKGKGEKDDEVTSL